MSSKTKKKMRPAQIMLKKEFMDVKRNPRSEFFQVYDLVNSNIQEWEIYVIGPPETPFQGGVYKAVMRFPDDYPMKPPSIQFLCEMLHPNIYRDGKVCISTLQTGPDGPDTMGHFWRPVLGIEQAILSVVSLLSDPNVDDPANTAAANMYKSHRKDFLKRCQALAKKSTALVPEDFEYPKVKAPGQTAKASKREGLRLKVESNTEGVSGGNNAQTSSVTGSNGDEESYYYDPEDLSQGGYEADSQPAAQSTTEHEHEKSKLIHRKDDQDPNDSNQSGPGSGPKNTNPTAKSGSASGSGGNLTSNDTSTQTQSTSQGTNQASALESVPLKDFTSYFEKVERDRKSLPAGATLGVDLLTMMEMDAEEGSGFDGRNLPVLMETGRRSKHERRSFKTLRKLLRF